jgi:hypothetical protein
MKVQAVRKILKALHNLESVMKHFQDNRKSCHHHHHRHRHRAHFHLPLRYRPHRQYQLHLLRSDTQVLT